MLVEGQEGNGGEGFGTILAGVEGGGWDIWMGGDKVLGEEDFGGEVGVTVGAPELEGWEDGGNGEGERDGGIGGMVEFPVGS